MATNMVCNNCGARDWSQQCKECGSTTGVHWSVAEERRKVAEASGRSLAKPSVAGQPLMLADELKKLAELRHSGILTDAEFDAQKAKLLESD